MFLYLSENGSECQFAVVRFYTIPRYFTAQNTKPSKIAKMAKKDHAGNVPSAVRNRFVTAGLRASMAESRARFDFRDAFCSF